MIIMCKNCGWTENLSMIFPRNTCPRCGQHLEKDIGGAVWVK